MKREALRLRGIGGVREQPAQVAVVEVRMFEAVVRALPRVVLAQRRPQPLERLDAAARRDDAAAGRRSPRISSSMYSSFRSAGQSA